ncbi:MAG: hypothetical protein HOH66_03280 [Rhodospirillaceae bacterium]|jgi:hypothetical protein|nr:hypothetical protein [Rhodospirillaceae bacterium]MBT6116867.1 hypothetical protein [Rhodospirillaceae bacterium]
MTKRDGCRSPIMPRRVAFYLLGTGMLAAICYMSWEAPAAPRWMNVALVAVPLQGTVWLYVLIGAIRRWTGGGTSRFMPRWALIYVTVAVVLSLANCLFWETTEFGGKMEWWVCTLSSAGALQIPLWLFLVAQAIWLSLRR